MKIVLKFIALVVFVYNCSNCSIEKAPLPKKGSAITYEFNRGRFGDNLASYTRAKWISHIFNIPLLYKPFPYSDELALHTTEHLFDKNKIHTFNKVIRLDTLSDNTIDRYANNLYVSHWGTKMGSFHENLLDKAFMNIIKQQISPRFIKNEILTKKDRFNVAVHIRNGKIYEPNCPVHDALRCPPLTYYIEQIKKMAELVQQPLFIHIFTDDSNPKMLLNNIQTHLKHLDIEYNFRLSGNQHDKNVVVDFFQMLQFDALIRSGSHYSTWVQRLGNFKITIFPVHASNINNVWVIDKVFIKHSD